MIGAPCLDEQQMDVDSTVAGTLTDTIHPSDSVSRAGSPPARAASTSTRRRARIAVLEVRRSAAEKRAVIDQQMLVVWHTKQQLKIQDALESAIHEDQLYGDVRPHVPARVRRRYEIAGLWMRREAEKRRAVLKMRTTHLQHLRNQLDLTEKVDIATAECAAFERGEEAEGCRRIDHESDVSGPISSEATSHQPGSVVTSFSEAPASPSGSEVSRQSTALAEVVNDRQASSTIDRLETQPPPQLWSLTPIEVEDPSADTQQEKRVSFCFKIKKVDGGRDSREKQSYRETQ